MVETYFPQKGDIVWLNFSPQAGHEQRGKRPAVVLSSNDYNKHGLALFCPITTKIKGYPFEIPVNTNIVKGVALADQIRNLDWKVRKAKFIVKLNKKTLELLLENIFALLQQ